MSEALQRRRRVIDFDDRSVPVDYVPAKAPPDDDAAGAATEGVFDEVVPVKAIAAKRDEKIARLQHPRIDDDVPDLTPRITSSDVTGDRVSRPFEGESQFVTQPVPADVGPPTPLVQPPHRQTAACVHRFPGISRGPSRQ